MKDSIPSKDEQIEALINGRAYELVLRFAGLDESGGPRYSEVFKVTKDEIKEYITRHYTLNNIPLIHSSPSREDGIYLIPIHDGYEFYDIEHGIRFTGKKVDSEDEAWSIVIDYILGTSGTGMKWE
jgi:hypothetical protein